MIEGSVDFVSTEKVIGWIGDKTNGAVFDVEAKLDAQVIGEAPAIIVREDLAAVGFGDGTCGFEIFFFRKLFDSELASVTVSPKGSTLTLARSSPETYSDAFRALLAEFPGAGRSRSVFGGLWIDRSDAMQILVGRIKVGTCDNTVFDRLRALIANGLVEIPLNAGANFDAEVARTLTKIGAKRAQMTSAATAFGERIFTGELVTILNSVFDDVPVFYRPTFVDDKELSFAQAASFDALNSPAELLVGYVLVKGDAARLDYVFDSHELPEFTRGGVSRWSPSSVSAIPIVASGSQRPVQSVDLNLDSLVIVGPGLIHRINLPEGAEVLRVVLSPQRVTPLRFLSSDLRWVEVGMGGGIKGRF